jgi:hypothetical protein
MAVNSIKKAADGTPTQKAEETEFQSDAGSMHIKSTAVHNLVKSNVEGNIINFSFNNSALRSSVETNTHLKLAAEGSASKCMVEGNFIKISCEASYFRFAREDYNTKEVWENGKCRTTKIALTHSTTQALISKSESFSINEEFERSYSMHQGKRFTINVPPFLDLAIIDASRPIDTEAEKEASNTAKGVNQLCTNSDKEKFDSRYKNNRAAAVDMINSHDTNFIYLQESDLPEGAIEKLNTIPEWRDNEQHILNQEGFSKFLLEMASPNVAGFPKHYTGFKGKGWSAEDAKKIGATCRLQISHGANQTIMVASHSLRTIRFNGVSTIDHGNVNLLYLGGKYEHIRGLATKLVEGSFIQHHRRPKDNVESSEPGNANVNYRFEDEASFAFVQPSDTQVNEIWALQLSHSGIDLGKVEATQGPRKFEHGFSLNDQHLKINHNSLIAIEANESIEFSGGNKPMKLDKSGLRVGGLFVRLDTFGPTVSVGRVDQPLGDDELSSEIPDE